MGVGYIFCLAFGLSMDAFAVSISSGARTKYRLLKHALIIALFFGCFQALMPALGWLAGLSFRHFIEGFDHWVAFSLLAILGAKMVIESFESGSLDKDESENISLTLSVLLTLSVATSIDALAVGIGMSCLKASILLPVIIIGVVTFLISAAGVLIGNKCGELFGKRFELAGGLILIAIGGKILFSHIGFQFLMPAIQQTAALGAKFVLAVLAA